jgi:hypothetical protein
MFDPVQAAVALIRTAIDRTGQASLRIDRLQRSNARKIRTRETVLGKALSGFLNAPSTASPVCAEALTRSALDPEPKVFIRALIDRPTFARIIAEVAATFPPESRASLSDLGRWRKARWSNST